jgi:hypothetical protein
MDEYVFDWKPHGADPEEDRIEVLLRDSYHNLKKMPEASRSVRTWLFAFLLGYGVTHDDSKRFLTQKQITPEMRFLIHGHDAKRFKKEIENDANAIQTYPWLFKLLTAMHALGKNDMHHRRGIDVHDDGTTSYDADGYGRHWIEFEQRWLSTIPLKDRTLAVCEQYVRDNFRNISDVPREILTEDLCIIALIKSRACAWPRIPPLFRTSKVWLVAFGMASEFKNVVPKAVKDEYPWVFELIAQMQSTSAENAEFEARCARDREKSDWNRTWSIYEQEARLEAIHNRNMELW